MNISQLPARPLAGDLKSCLAQLHKRGDKVEVQAGKLVITPKSGKPVPASWLNKHEEALVCDITKLTNRAFFKYEGYKRGKYGANKAGGISLQLTNLEDNTDCYTIFNAKVTRQRTTKQGKRGELLPAKQFTVSKKMAFYEFWKSTGLKLPGRLSKFWSCMGNLKALYLTGSYDPKDIKRKKLLKRTLKPLTITHEELIDLALFIPNSCPTREQAMPKPCPRVVDKETSPAQQPQGLQPVSATGTNKYGKKVIREGVISKPYAVTSPMVSPKDQTVDEWLEDYELAAGGLSY